ncbi:MAG: tetratricopeptide repeat protein [Treponema sp.]|jgi:tetratricopeptide (TPR) repeat protein|nr:tetratricopeptide repeat protein [Treponema sp.]
MKKNIFFIFLAALILSGSCSSAPKKPAEIVVLRRQAEQELDLGNKAVVHGQYNNALLLLTEAKRKAVSVDDVSLVIRTSLSYGNLLLSMNRINEAFAEWDSAIAEAQRFGNTELLSVSRIFRAKGSLLTGRDTARNVLDLTIREQANIVKDRYYIAFSWQVRGLALRALESYTEAENSIRRGLEIHEKDRYLEDASYDWYIIASIRSLAGNYSGAIQALEEAIAIDRRIENSWGLAASWKALGDVYTKMGRSNEAASAHARSKAITEAAN